MLFGFIMSRGLIVELDLRILKYGEVLIVDLIVEEQEGSQVQK